MPSWKKVITSGSSAHVSHVTASGNVEVNGDLFATQYIKHKGDADTFINFTDNRIRLKAGNIGFFDMEQDGSAPYPATINPGGNRVNFRAMDRNTDLLLKTDSEEFNVKLYHAGNQKLVTTATGVEVTGNVSGSSTSTGSFGRIEATNISGTFSGTTQGNNSGDVTIASGMATPDYITISGQEITPGLIDLTTDVTGTLPVANGGTGATSLNNLITLGTHTTGDYVHSLTAGTGIDLANNSGETASPTVSVDVSDFMTNGSDNRVVTATGTDAMNAEANLTFNGNALSVTSAADPILVLNKTGGNNGAIHFQAAGAAKAYIYSDANGVLKFGNTTTNPVLTLNTNGTIAIASTIDGRDLATDGSKLDGIESGATADQTASEIRALVESASDSNVFTDSDHSKLNAIEASATADQTITAGSGLTGGGTGDVTLNVGAGTGVTVNANDIAIGQAVATSDNVTFGSVTTTGNVSGSSTSIGSFGELIVAGNITAKQYIVSASTTYMTTSFSDGNTKFGDSSGDVHQFTGSFKVQGSILTNDSVTIGSEELESNFSSSIAGRVNTLSAAGSGITISNNSNNRILTGDGTNANAESNLTFDGAVLGVTSSANSPSPTIQMVNTNTSQLSGSRIEFYRDKTHNSGDEIGAIDFFHKNTNIEKIRYAAINARQWATVNGNEGAFFAIRAKTISVADNPIGLMQFTGSGYGTLRLGDHRTIITGSSNSTASFGKIVGDTFHGDGSNLTNITATTATTATNVTLTANNSNNETVYLTFADGVSGGQGLETDSGLTYNPSTEILHTTTFDGALTGNATTATTATNVNVTANNTENSNDIYLTFVDGASGAQGLETDLGLTYNPSVNTLTTTTFDGNATTATTATNVSVTANNTTNENVYLAFADGTSGAQGIETDTNLTYNPATNTLATTTFSGNATTATTATNVNVTANNTSNENIYVTFVDGTSGAQGIETDTNLTYNPATNTLSSTNFSGTATTATNATNVTLTANNTENVSAYLTFADGSSGTQGLETDANLTYNPSVNTLTATTFSGNATTATLASTVTLTANNSSNENVYLTFADGVSGAKGLETDSALSYNPALNTLTATNFSGTATTATTATNVTATANNTENVSAYLTFVDGASGTRGIETDSSLRYNPSTDTLSATNFSGTITSATSATTATNVTLTSNNSADETVYIPFADGSTGTQGLETDANLTYNPQDNQLTAGTFNGNLTGNATTATTSTSITLSSNNAADETVYLTFADGQTGTQDLETDGNLTWNPSTNILNAGTFNGSLTGNATTATSTSNITLTSNNAADETVYLTFADGSSGTQGLETDANLTYNPQDNQLTAGTFNGNLTGNATTATTSTSITLSSNNAADETVYLTFADGQTGTQDLETDGNLTWNPSTNILNAGTFNGSLTGNATTATSTSNITLTSNNATDETVYLTFADGSSGTQGLETDGNLTYNPQDNQLTAGTFSGALSGNATSATTATNVTLTSNNATDETVYLTFADGSTGTQGLETDANLTYNPSTNTLSSANFSGTATTATTATKVSVTSNASTNENNYITFVDASAGGNTVEYDSTLRYNPNSNALTASILRATNDVIVDDDLYVGGGLIDLKNTGTQSQIRMYCESSNAHYVGLQAPAHSDFSGNVAVTLPATATTLIGRNTTDTLTNKTIGQNLLPDGDNTRDLGSGLARWRNLYTGDLHLSNEGSKGNDVDKTTGDWTIQEGQDDLYLFNNKTGKKYKFKLEEL